MHGFGIALAYVLVSAVSFWAGWSFYCDETGDDERGRHADADHILKSTCEDLERFERACHGPSWPQSDPGPSQAQRL